MVNDVIVKFIDDLKAKQQIRLFDEAATKQAIIRTHCSKAIYPNIPIVTLADTQPLLSPLPIGKSIACSAV